VSVTFFAKFMPVLLKKIRVEVKLSVSGLKPSGINRMCILISAILYQVFLHENFKALNFCHCKNLISKARKEMVKTRVTAVLHFNKS